MRTEAYVLEQLLGMQPWRVPGSTEFRPSLLERLSFSRPEGYETVNQLPLDGASANWLFPQGTERFTEMIGTDSCGVATFIRADGDLALTRHKTIEGVVTPLSLGDRTSPAHIEGFGAYASLNYFIGENSEEEVFGPIDGQQVQNVSPRFDIKTFDTIGDDGEDAGSGAGDGPTHGTAATYHSGTGEWMVAVGTQLFYTDNIDAWDNAARTIPSGTWTAMHSNGSVILIVGAGGSVLRSENDGVSWTDVSGSPIGSQDLLSVQHGGGLWVVGGTSRGLWYSSDGTSWSAATIQNVGLWSLPGGARIEDVDYASEIGSWVAGAGQDSYGWKWALISNDGQNWQPRDASLGFIRGIAMNGDGVAVTVSDITPRTPDWNRGYVSASFDAGANWPFQGQWPDRGRAHDVVWDGSRFWAVGDKPADGGGITGIVYSSAEGTEWSIETGKYNVSGMPLRRVIVGADGTVIAFPESSGSYPAYIILKRGSESGGAASTGGYQPGDYELIWLAVVGSGAGKVVVRSGSTNWSFRYGSRGSVGAWAPAAPTGLEGALSYEIYIRYAPEIRDEATDQFRIEAIEGRDFILAKVLDAGEGTAEAPEQVPYPEIGRVLPDVGNVGTAAMRGHAAFWNDRIWFAPSGDEDAYDFVRGEPRMSSLRRPLTVAFTELEYLNLTSESAYLHLPQGNSTRITGIIGTPSGLMVFGQNDAHLISGDPAIEGSLQVERFPAAIGCDPGIQPTSLAGVVFTIWRGRLYAIDGANATDVSRGVLDGLVTVRDIAPDVETTSIAVLTDEAVLHFDLSVGEWYLSERLDKAGTAHVFGEGSRLIPCLTGLFAFSFEDVSGTPTGFITTYAETGEPYDQPGLIEWRGVDAGNAYRADYWRYVRLPVDVEDGEFDLAAGAVPYLYWRARPSQPDVSAEDPAYRVTGMLREGELIFKLPYGHLSRRLDIRVVIPMEQRMAVQPGVSFGYSPGPLGDNLPPA